MDGVPVTSDRAQVPAPGDAGRGTSGIYRPRYELVAERILQLIGELGLHAGDRMPTENDLAARLGTSRTVVRDAVKILSATGRVSAQKGRGLYVADGESTLAGRRWGRFFLVSAVREARMLQRQASVIGLRGVGGHADDAVDEHEAIYRAIRDGDPQAAAQATSVHLDNTLEDYRREIQRRVFG